MFSRWRGQTDTRTAWVVQRSEPSCMSREQSSIPLAFIAIGNSYVAGCRLTHDPCALTTQTMLYNSEAASLL